jgi:hypothetical protein
MSANTSWKTMTRFFVSLCVLTLSLSHAQTGEQVWGYKVKPGDRLIDISKAYQKSPDEWKKLQQKNAVPDPKLLAPGKQINIPVADLRQGNPVAEAVLVHGDVQRLDKAGQLVGKLSSGEALKMGDTVQTGSRSTLTIRFADDSRMLITEKSKITLSSLVNYGKTGMADTKVQVHEGGTDSQVSPQKGPVARYEINTPAINLTVRGTGFRVQVDEASGATRTEVVEGLVAGNTDGSQAMIANGFGIIAEPGKPLGKPSQLLGAPVLNAATHLVERMPVRFEWQALSGAQRYRLQLLASVQGNDAIIFDEVLQTTKVQWDDLPDGDFVLRVRGVDAVGLEGANAVIGFKLKARPEPPVLNFPQNGHDSASEKIFFRWESALDANEYVFQLAEDADFKRVLAFVPQISNKTRGILLALPSGQYFWRVASVSTAGNVGPYGDAFTFLQQSALTQGN